MKSNEKSIMCPFCKNFITNADKNDTTLHKIKHKKCGLWIWYIPKTDEFKIYDVPERECSSGKRFY